MRSRIIYHEPTMRALSVSSVQRRFEEVSDGREKDAGVGWLCRYEQIHNSDKTKGRNWQEDASPLMRRSEPGSQGNCLGCSATGQNVSALSAGLEWNECHEASSPLSHPNLHRLIDEMKLPKFLRLPKIRRRARSKARSETGPIEGQSEANLATPRPTESTPDLRIGTSTLPAPSPLVLSNQESNGM